MPAVEQRELLDESLKEDYKIIIKLTFELINPFRECLSIYP